MSEETQNNTTSENNPFDKFTEHQRKAFEEASKAIDALLPTEFKEHGRAALEEFVSRAPGSTEALIRLVEIAIDADLADVASHAQAQLADAYLKAGQAAEALVVIEDLAAREGHDRAHIDRMRQALTALGESDVDTAIVRKLNVGVTFGDDAAGF